MPGNYANEAQSSAFIKHFMERLRAISTELFCERFTVMSGYYAHSFDNVPACVAIIAVPADKREVEPTTYMMYREARFVLDSDRDEDAELANLWTRLHKIVATDASRQLLTAFEILNAEARRRVALCHDQILDIMPAVLLQLDLGDYGQAYRLANDTCREIEQTAHEIIKSYALLTAA